MDAFELKLWRVDMDWTQERAAEELGCSLRTYLNWETKGAAKTVELATRYLTMKREWASTLPALKRISKMAGH